MKLRMIDAIDLFGLGGYIDLTSGQYVPRELAEDNANAAETGERLVAPVIRLTYVAYIVAI